MTLATSSAGNENFAEPFSGREPAVQVSGNSCVRGGWLAPLMVVIRQLNHEEAEEEETVSTTASFWGQSSTATKTKG